MTDQTTIDDARQAAATEPSVTEPATPLPATKPAPAPGTEQTPASEAAPADKPKPPDPRDLAIRRLAFEQRETKRQLKEAQERLERAQPKDPNAPLTQADVERIAEERAQVIIAQREQTAKNEAWVAKGTADYPDFNERCNILADIGAGDNPAFMAAIGRLPAGHKVIAELADDPAEATRILKLSPVDLALELAGISSRIAALVPAATTTEEPTVEIPKPVVSKAPPPIKPLATTARAEKRPEDMTEAEYQAHWNKKTRGARG